MDSSALYVKKRQSVIPMLNFLFFAAVFACVLFPGFSQYKADQKAKKDLEVCRANILKLKDIVEEYRKAHRGNVPERLVHFTLKGPDHAFDALPRCPAYDGDDKGMVYAKGYTRKSKTASQPAEFTICCYGHSHADLGLDRDQPYYSSINGAHPTDAELVKIRSMPRKKAEAASKTDKDKRKLDGTKDEKAKGDGKAENAKDGDKAKDE